MLSKRAVAVSIFTLVVLSSLLAAPVPAFAASKEKVLYSFCSVPPCTDGFHPNNGLILDAAGNLYGTTYQAYGAAGTVFELTPGTDGTWSEKTLYTFCANSNKCPDGDYPSAGVIFDAAGNLYGITDGGGALGGGVVFQLTPGAGGSWSEKVLHNFDVNVAEPAGGLAFDAAGNLYGTIYYGGTHNNCGTKIGCGIAFRLTPGANGKWAYKVLHNFNDNGKDGFYPAATLTTDASGNVYGTTTQGGRFGYGTVFELTPGSNDKWTETILHSFDESDGAIPSGSVTLDPAGNLYGLTYFGGDGGCSVQGVNGCGTVFELVAANGKWREKVLRSFLRPRGPTGGVVLGAAGNLYGTTGGGGRYDVYGECTGCGTAFELSPGPDDKWTESTLHSFGKGDDGSQPTGSLIFDTAGSLYGTTWYGGDSGSNCGPAGCGTVFEITP